MEHAEKNFVRQEAIRSGLLIRMIRDPDPVTAYSFDDRLDIHSHPSSQFSSPDSNPTRTSRFWRTRAVNPQIWRLPTW